MAFPLDPEQRRAVGSTGFSVVLTAGAGCGKTGTITARFLYLLGKREPPVFLAPYEERVHPGRIGVLTFTNKAAAELRHRIRSACESEQNRCEDSDSAEYWRLVSFAIDGVTISTYHSFYEQLCREFSANLELDPFMRLIDDRIAAGLKREAARDAVRERLSIADSALIEYAARHRLDGVVDQLVALVSMGEHQTRASEIAQMDIQSLKNRWLAEWGDSVEDTASVLSAIILKILSLPAQGLTAKWSEKTAAAAAALERLDEDRYGPLIEAAEALGGHSPKRADLVASLAELKAVKESPTYRLMKADLALMDTAAAETILLARLVDTTKQKYDDRKRSRRAVDFDDLVEKTKLLTDLGFSLGGAAGTIFDHFLVDEFQDTDRLQAEVLKALAGPSFDQGRLFVVGDMKQSIYRFRGSDPEAILRLRGDIPQEGRLRLSTNYRSRRPIVEFVNVLAESMYTYLDDDFRLVSGLIADPERIPDSAAIEFLWTVPKPKDPTASAESSTESDSDEIGFEAQKAEAANLAAHLRRRIDAGLPVGAKRNDGKAMMARAGDIVLLSRSRTHWWIYERAMRDQGFEVHQDAVGGFFERQEVRDLIGLLAVVENRMDDIHLAACLRSPIFGVTDETLFILANSQAGSTFAERFWSRDEKQASIVSSGDRDILERGRKMILDLNRMKATASPSEVVRSAIEETGYASIVKLTADEPGRAIANLERLVDDARSFDHDPDFGWSAMIRQWLADIRVGSKTDEAVVDAPTGKIRFLTIHSAKGLEFPVVLMPGLNSPASNRTGPYLIHPRHGLVTRSRSSDTDDVGSDDHPGLLMAKTAVRHEEEKETDNLLYVATTRAKDHLILSATFDPDSLDKDGAPRKPSGPFLKRIANAFDLRTGRAWKPQSKDAPQISVEIFGPEE